MIDIKSANAQGETAVLVGLITAPGRDTPGQSPEQVTEYLNWSSWPRRRTSAR